MKRFLLIFVIIFTLLLPSCRIKNNGNKNEEKNPPDTEGFWSSFASVNVVSAEDGEWAKDFSERLEKSIGKSVNVRSDLGSDKDCQIIIGKSSHEASAKAYQLLERRISEIDEENIGYLVYVKGNTIAIAYVGIAARDELTSVLFDEYFVEGFSPKDGTLCSKVFSLTEFANERRNEQRERQFAEVETKHGKAIADALRDLYSLFGAETYIWMANLYDPETSAFYFSNSGRDNMGFLPDVESTQQVLSSLAVGGMLREKGGITDALSEVARDTLVKWIQSLQSSEDGYFYHPQWGTEIDTTRRSRDMDWSISLLNEFGAVPLYDTPTGVKGSLGAPGKSPVSSPLWNRSAVSAVSMVIRASNGALPYYLSSTAAFEDYIVSLDIPNNSYAAGNKLAADHALIKKAGDEYVDILIDYLNEAQIKELGVWQRAEDDTDYDPYDGVGYDSLNGLMKIACIYDFLEREMPNVDKAMESAIKVGLYRNTSLDEHVCCTYNAWATMDMLIKFEQKYGSTASAEMLRQKILDVAPELIEATYEKIATHYVIGGGFSYNESRPCNTSQGAYTACASTPEADVNATAVVASNMISTMFYALGIDRVFLWCPEDFYVFDDIIQNSSKPIKHALPEIEPITFDDYEKSEIVSGSELEPAENMLVEVSDFDYFSSAVVERPYSTSTKDKALRTEVKNLSEGLAHMPSSTNVYIANSYQRGSTFVFECDILVESTTNDVFAQIMFAPMSEGNPSFSLNLSAVNKNGKQLIRIGDNYTGTDGVKNSNLYTGCEVGEWFTLRIEMYKVFEDNAHGVSELKEIYGKIYINGEYVATSDAGYVHSSSPGVVKNREVAKVYVSHYRRTESVLYFDNILCEKTDDEYVPTTVYNPDAPNLPDIEIGDGEDYNYAAKFEGGILNDAYLHNYVNDGGDLINVMSEGFDPSKYSHLISYSLSSDIGGRASTVLKISTEQQTVSGVSSSIVRVSNTQPKGTTYTFEAKMYYESVFEAGAATQLHFKDSDGRIHFSLNIAYSNDGYLYLSENNSTGTGQQKPIEGANFAMQKWFTLKIVFYRTAVAETTRAKIYTEDKSGATLCVADVNAYNAPAIGSDTPLANVEIAHQRLNAATLCLDDVSFTRRESEYEEEAVTPIEIEDVLTSEPSIPDEPNVPNGSDAPDEPVTPPPSAESDGTDGGALTPDNIWDKNSWT